MVVVLIASAPQHFPLLVLFPCRSRCNAACPRLTIDARAAVSGRVDEIVILILLPVTVFARVRRHVRAIGGQLYTRGRQQKKKRSRCLSLQLHTLHTATLFVLLHRRVSSMQHCCAWDFVQSTFTHIYTQTLAFDARNKKYDRERSKDAWPQQPATVPAEAGKSYATPDRPARSRFPSRLLSGWYAYNLHTR